MRTITLPEVRRAAKTLDPKKMNPQAVLVHGNGQPCCLVGHIMRRVGAPLTFSGPQAVLGYIDWLGSEHGIEVSPSATLFLETAQKVADGWRPTLGCTWGAAIKAGNRAVAG